MNEQQERDRNLTEKSGEKEKNEAVVLDDAPGTLLESDLPLVASGEEGLNKGEEISEDCEAEDAAVPRANEPGMSGFCEEHGTKDEVPGLKEEIRRLREELEQEKTGRERLKSEYEEFTSLYPGVSLKRIPNEVRDTGLPLCAAYALYEKKLEAEKKAAEAVNQLNRTRSSGGIASDAGEVFYSPAEVRAMSRKEVQEHYHEILYSMQKW